MARSQEEPVPRELFRGSFGGGYISFLISKVPTGPRFLVLHSLPDTSMGCSITRGV